MLRARYEAALAAIALGCLAACSPEAPEGESKEEAQSSPAPPTTADPGGAPQAGSTTSPTTGGDGSAIMLSQLDQADIEANPIEGELACSFSPDGSDGLYILARGFVADDSRAQGLVKIGDHVQRIVSSEDGGYDGMIDGASFGSQGITMEVTLTSDEGVGRFEAPVMPAQLLLQRGDGTERVISGTWTCGP